MSPEVGRQMASTDLSSSSKPQVHRRVSLRQPLSCGFTIVLCSCLFFGAAQCRAQASQDVAEAARQERARKDQTKKQKHVYTDEDLRRAKILTPEDGALVEAKRKLQAQPAEEQAQAPIDADTGLAQLPLGDIARRYRNAKIAAQPADPFHLPFDELVFAAPVISVPSLEPSLPDFSPARPNVVRAHPSAAAVAPAVSSTAPVQGLEPAISLPKLARPAQSFSPAHPTLAPEHPNSVVAPAISSPAPLRRLDPFTRRFAPSAPPSVSRVAPSSPQPKAPPATVPSAQPRFVAPPIAPLAPRSNVAASIAPSSAVAKTPSSLHTVIIQPGDSLWKLAQKNLGRGSRWQELLPVNPSVVDPTRIAAGTEIVIPAKITGLKSDLKVTVKMGDTLTSIARVTYGRAAAWRCIAQANPEIADANRIYEGQQLLLPFNCQH
jgi:nucleoid-associated protein YgaU